MTLARKILFKSARNFRGSIWVFPLILTILLFLLAGFKINGSSMGVYHTVFYGSSKDSSLLLGKPRPIRSDEWLVNTQMTIAQKNNNYQRVNENVGMGEDVSILVDAPYKDWSVLFKPQNLSFFVLPFEHAFAFKWWLICYLLILSCYFFTLELLPRKRLLASLVSVALFLSPFVQWWYLSGTMAPIYYSLFAAVIIMKMFREKSLRLNVFWGVLLVYVGICFALILYPPFQIPCAIALAAFLIGFILENLKLIPKAELYRALGVITVSAVLVAATVLLYLGTRSQVINTVQNTSYPGKRIQLSGGYDLPHLLSSHLATELQFSGKAAQYVIPPKGIVNQSEASNFILLLPFMFVPSVVLLVKRYRNESVIDWILITTGLLFLVFMVRLFVPHFNWFFKLLLLDIVPHNRLLIGLGMLNFIHLIILIRSLQNTKQKIFGTCCLYLYIFIIFIVELVLGLYAKARFPGFINTNVVWALAIPVPVIVYMLLTKRINSALVVLVIFSGISTGMVNPIYKGTETITNTPISNEIKRLSISDEEGRWAIEGIIIENFALLNGARSLSGVYTYPQLDMWRQLDHGNQDSDYNRYAHVNFAFDRNPAENIQPNILLVGGDNFHVNTEPCSNFIRDSGVRFLLTSSQLNGQDSCAYLASVVKYPSVHYYIYRLSFTK